MVYISMGDARVDEQLVSRHDRYLTAVVRLDETTHAPNQAKATVISNLKRHASQTQQPLKQFADRRRGIEITKEFWITNAAVVEVDTDVISLRELASVENVERIHENHEVRALGGSATGQVGASNDGGTLDADFTYGLEQINVPETWDEFGTQGAGVKISVLDTGIDVDHPDLELYSEDPDDPTYPGGWAVFTGEDYDEPGDGQGHGTHVSGTVAGGDDSGTHIGVAPDCDLMHGKVLDDGGFGDFDYIVDGIQWSVDNGADVINMSLGVTAYEEDYIDILQNVQAAGVLVVSASGNDGEGTSGSPANVYGAGMAIGATDDEEEVWGFSSGEKVVTDEDWSGADEEDIEDWPDEYIVPDVAAPGDDVFSAMPGGDYDELSGTSMASPHVAGVAGLMLSAGGTGTDPEQVWQTLEDTAWKPDGWDEDDAEAVIDGKDSRYGKGIVDTEAAVSLLALDSGIEGTVEDEGEDPIDGITVEIGDTTSVQTDDEGNYSVILPADDYTVTVDGFGYESVTESVTVEEDAMTEQNFTVGHELDGRVLDPQPDAVEGGESLETTIEVAHADTVTVSQDGDYDEADATLSIDGTDAEFDEPAAVADGFTEVTIEVETTEETSGDIELRVSVDGDGEPIQLATGSTTVFETLIRVGVIDAEANPDDIVGTLEDKLPGMFAIESVSTADAVDSLEEYESFVVQLLDKTDDHHEDFISATEDEEADVGVVYLDQFSFDPDTDADAITQYAEIESDIITDTFQDDEEDGNPVSYEITGEHDILPGYEADDTVEIHDFDWADRAWFESSEDVVDLADVSNGVGDTNGPALGVHEERRTVFAGSLGRSQWVTDDHYTTEANEILAAAVEWAADAKDDLWIDAPTTITAQPGGETTLELTATELDALTVHELWTDWGVTAAEDGGADQVDDDVGDYGTFSLGWDEKVSEATVTLDIDLHDDYVGGTFVLVVTAAAGDESVTATVHLEIE